MKKILSLALALTLMLGLAAPAFAVGTPVLSMTADKQTAAQGETVTLSIDLDTAIENCGCFELYVYYDADLFTLNSGLNGTSNAMNTHSTDKTDKNGNHYISIGFINDYTGKDLTAQAGRVYNLSFTAAAQVSEAQNAVFGLAVKDITDTGFSAVETTVPADSASMSVSVTPPESYIVNISGNQTKAVGETAAVAVNVTGSGYTDYNAVDMTFTYDSARLSLATTAIDGYTVTAGEGTVRVQGCGAAKSFGQAFVLNFTTIASGDAAVTLTSAKIDRSENAVSDDAPEASKGNTSAIITIGSYTVDLGADFTGANTVALGEDYTFTATNNNYNYTFSATMNGNSVAVTNNGDGSYTISNVSGNLVITAVKTPKTYAVSVSGTGTEDVNASATAIYNTPYNFNVTKTSGYTYAVSVTVGGVDYTGYTASGDTYTIPGTDITGDIAISVSKTVIPGSTVGVTFEGTGAGDATGAAIAVLGQAYSFTVTQDAQYDYEVTATVGGSAVTVTSNDGETYTIPGANVTAAIVITVSKTAKQTVAVSEYVKLDGSAIYLITVSGSLNEGYVFAYDSAPMFYSEKYQAYAWLVVSNEDIETFETEAAGLVASIEATSPSVVYDGDVNGTGMVDINDAQLVYDMYNADYAGFDNVSMVKFLRADLNGSKALTVEDVTAAIYGVQ